MKLNPRIAEKVVTVLSCCFILLFVYAAGSKWKEGDLFLAQVGQSPMLTWWANVVVVLVPSLEVLITIMLMVPKWRLAGLYAFFQMMVMFTAYIFIITRYATYVPCSCGGILSKMTWDIHFVFNIAMIALAVLAILIYPPGSKLSQRSTAHWSNTWLGKIKRGLPNFGFK